MANTNQQGTWLGFNHEFAWKTEKNIAGKVACPLFSAHSSLSPFFAGNLTFDPSKPDGTMQKLLDVSKLNQMGWKSTTPLRNGIASVYKAYLMKAS